jgi:hypothetical protein
MSLRSLVVARATRAAAFTAVSAFSTHAFAQDPSPEAPPAAPPSSSVKMTLEATRIDAPAPAPPPAPPKTINDDRLLHGFRIGYGYVLNYDRHVAGLDGASLKERADLRAPSHLLLGYEVLYRVVSHSWLNVLLLANGMIAGLEQSKFLPSGNFLIGAELKNSFQMGVGTNISPLKGSEAHAVIAAGWTPQVGSI